MLELRREIDKRISGKHPTLFGGMEAHESLPPVDEERVYTALRHLCAGKIEDARRELERAFGQHFGGTPIPEELKKHKGETDQRVNKLSHWIWRRYASCVWDDIRIDRVLPYKEARGPDDEKHVHPLQLDVIERTVAMWSNPGDVVLTPFMGVGSEVYGAVRNGRRGIGVELKGSYFKQAKANVAMALEDKAGDGQSDLFSQEDAA